MVTIYPAQIDNSLTLPLVIDGTTQASGSIINALRGAIIATETQLGVQPAGIYGTVRARLDYLEAGLNSVINTGSSGVQLARDLGGTFSAPLVIGLQGNAIKSQSLGAGEDGYALTWVNTDSRWEAQPVPSVISTFAVDGASSPITAGQAVMATNGNVILAAEANLSLGLTHAGIALTSGSAGNQIRVLTQGPLSPSIFNLGDGYVCRVGTDPAGNPVRVNKGGIFSGGSVTVNAIAGTFTRSGGSFLIDDFAVGDTVFWLGFLSNSGLSNNGIAVITHLSASVMTVSGGGQNQQGLVNETNSNVQCTSQRATSGLQYLGWCDVNGAITVSPELVSEFNVLDFGAIADSNGSTGTDNLAAFNACHAAFEVNEFNGVAQAPVIQYIKIPAGQYYLSNTWHISHAVNIVGEGFSTQDTGEGTTLLFPKNTAGIFVHAPFLKDLPGAQTGTGTVIRDLAIQCNDLTTTSGHGLEVRVVCQVRGLQIGGFGGNGIEANGDSGELTGNLSGSIFDSNSCGSNRGHGIHIYGGDANACVVLGGAYSYNQGYGAFDQSGFGCTFLGCVFDGNQGHIAIQFSTVVASTTATSATVQVSNPMQLGLGHAISIAGVTGNKKITNLIWLQSGVDNSATTTVSAAGKTFTRSTGSFLTDGWAMGNLVEWHGFKLNNGVFTITNVTAFVMTVSETTYDESSVLACFANGGILTLDSTCDATVAKAIVSQGYGPDLYNHDIKNQNLNYSSSSTVVIGCYSEVAQNDLSAPAFVTGGQLASTLMANPSAMVWDSNNAIQAPIFQTNSHGAVPIQIQLGDNSSNMFGLVLQANEADYWALKYNAVNYRWDWELDASTSWISMSLFTPGASFRTNGVGFMNGIVFGSDTSSDGWETQQCMHAAPVSGTWERGDIVWNSSPSITSNLGWVCTTSGAPGTWTEFGSATAAGGDLSGNYPNPSVSSINSNAVSNTVLGASEDGYVLTWINSASQYQAVDFWQHNLMSGKRIQYWAAGEASSISNNFGLNCQIEAITGGAGIVSGNNWGTPSPFTLLNTTPRWQLSTTSGSTWVGVMDSAYSTATGDAFGFWRGNAAGLGGFTIGARCGIDAVSASAHIYFLVGITDGYVGGTPEANYDWTSAGSTTYNVAGFAFNLTASSGAFSGNYKFVTTTAGTAPTVTDTGMAVNTGHLMEFIMQSQPNGSNISWTINDLTASTTASGTQSSTLPTNTAHMIWSSGYYAVSAAATCYFSVHRFFSET